MTEKPEPDKERLAKFWEDVERRAQPHRDQAFSYEELAVDFSKKGFETLTYLNGGALVALPAALAFFKADVPAANILAVAAAFIVGLLAVVIGQVMAFFTMAKRAESAQFNVHHAVLAVSSTYNAPNTPDRQKRDAEAKEAQAKAGARLSSSNKYRLAGLIIYGVSVVAFISGCTIGAAVVLFAKNAH